MKSAIFVVYLLREDLFTYIVILMQNRNKIKLVIISIANQDAHLRQKIAM